MTDITYDQAAQELQALADQLLMGEIKEWPVMVVYQRFAQVVPQHRHDQVIRTVGGMIEKMAQQDPGCLITGEELFGLYDSVAGLNPQSAFRQVFADLLPPEIAAIPDNDQTRLDDRRHQMFDEARDPEVLAKSAETIEVDELSDETPQRNHLGEISDPNDFVQEPALVQEGRQLVQGEMQRLGQSAIKARLTFANQNMMVFDVVFQGPEGEGSFAVPVEIQDGQITIPTDFGTEQKGYPLTQAGIQSYFSDQRIGHEEQERTAAQRIRDIYAGDARALEEAGTFEISEDELIGEDEQSVQLPNELQDVEGILSQAVLRKESRYTDGVINDAAMLLQRRLQELGFTNPQASFIGDAQANAMRFKAKFATTQGETEIGVPIEINQEGLMFPVVFIGADEGMYEFSPQGFASYLAQEDVSQPVAHSSADIDLTYNELQKVVHEAAADGRSNVATEALNIIGDKFGKEAYDNAVADYQKQLSGLQADYEAHCQGCAFFKSARQEKAPYADDHCLLINVACKQVTKTADGRGPGHCIKSETKFRAEHDEAYSGLMNTSQVSLT